MWTFNGDATRNTYITSSNGFNVEIKNQETISGASSFEALPTFDHLGTYTFNVSSTGISSAVTSVDVIQDGIRKTYNISSSGTIFAIVVTDLTTAVSLTYANGYTGTDYYTLGMTLQLK